MKLPSETDQIGPSHGCCAGSPKLAIVVNCYNYVEYVGCAIRSVQDQLTRECELVVVDDGSTDGSWEAIQQTGVRAIRKGNGGQISACLLGVEATQSPFILFLDADDALKPGAIAKILPHLDPGVAKMQFPLSIIDAKGELVRESSPRLGRFREKKTLARRILRTGVYCTPPTSGNVFRRDVCELLYQVDYEKTVDGIILFAAPFMGDIVSVSEPLGVYRLHDRNKSGIGREINAVVVVHQMERFKLRLDHLRKVLSKVAPEARLVKTELTFYFREKSFCLSVARGERIGLAQGIGIVATLFKEWESKEGKAPLYAAFYMLLSLLPSDRAKALLSDRFELGQRPLSTLSRHLGVRNV